MTDIRMIESSPLQILTITDEAFGVNTYCLIAQDHVVLIDPIESKDLEQSVSGRSIDFVILTHEHFDHIRGVNSLRKGYKTIILCGKNAKEGLSNPVINLSRYADRLASMIPFGGHKMDVNEYVCFADDVIDDGQIVEWQGHVFLFKDTPGHSKGSISIVLDNTFLFSGDTFFKEYPTATRMPGGNTKALQTITIPWAESLPQNIIVFPGHTESFELSERYK